MKKKHTKKQQIECANLFSALSTNVRDSGNYWEVTNSYKPVLFLDDQFSPANITEQKKHLKILREKMLTAITQIDDISNFLTQL